MTALQHRQWQQRPEVLQAKLKALYNELTLLAGELRQWRNDPIVREAIWEDIEETERLIHRTEYQLELAA